MNVLSGAIWHCLKRERDIGTNEGHVERHKNSLQVKPRLNRISLARSLSAGVLTKDLSVDLAGDLVYPSDIPLMLSDG